MLKFVLLKFLIVLSRSINAILRPLIGFSTFSGWGQDRERSRAIYGQSVHRCNIWLRAKLVDIGPSFPENFLLTHESYDHPRSLLKDNVSLLTVDGHHAYFVQGPVGMNFFGSQEYPFSFITHFQCSTQLLLVPLDHFLRFAQEDLPEPTVKSIVFISMTGRCGSTLLTQMFEQLPRTVTLSEPDFLILMNTREGSQRTNQAFVENKLTIMRAAIKAQCKDLVHTQVDHIVVKLRPNTVAITPEIVSVFPGIRHVFLYRSPKNTVISFISMAQSMPAWLYERFLWRYYFSQIYLCLIPKDSDKGAVLHEMYERSLVDYDHVRCWTELTMGNILCCREYMNKGLVDFLPVSYESLIASPIETMSQILEHCHMSTSQVEKCLKALETDSQKGTQLSQAKLKKSRKSSLTPQEIQGMEWVMEQLDFPPVDQWESIFRSKE